MSPADLQQLVDAANKLQAAGTGALGAEAAAADEAPRRAPSPHQHVSQQLVEQVAPLNKERVTGLGAMAAGSGHTMRSSHAVEGFKHEAAGAGASRRPYGLDDAADASATAQVVARSGSLEDLTARFTHLLARLDAQQGDAVASELPAGVAARVSAATTAAPSSAAAAAAADGPAGPSLTCPAGRGGSSTAAASTDARRVNGVLVLTELPQDNATAALWQGLGAGANQTAGGDDVDGGSPWQAGDADGGGGGGDATSASEGYLEGLQQTGALLQAALTRHDALMQLIGSLQGQEASGGDMSTDDA